MIYGDEKACSHCKRVQPIAEFYLTAKGHRASWCRECKRVLARSQRRRPDQQDVWRRSKLYRRFGMTVEDYEALADAQDDRCAVCGQPETRIGRGGEVKRLAVDHDHDTDAIRGLLCQNCNLAVGLLLDDPELARALADYLESRRAAEAGSIAGVNRVR